MTDAYDAQLRGDKPRPAWLLYVASTPAVRYWSGIANFKLGAGSGPDTDGGLYFGLGILVSVPTLPIPLNGDFAALELKISGVRPAVAAKLRDDAPAVRQARISLASMELDDAGAPLAAPDWVWHGWVNTPRIGRDGTAKPPMLAISLMCSTGSPKRTVTNGGNWTGPQQRLIDPNDSSCDRVSGYATGTDENWPI